ncbi:hypothetical protein A2707_04330 [Candidatus Saccharibacteria bacterium RIFCSPHIGHO2_01_FULL_45_15]|nr:MAG: hypothetical protein A2707_04330 [Candidatus Saccharibacteria bacterium RIFCSPHIGHO2_01_FULL_45_15]OGL27167.1 MAG: hypothetical protein A3C39_01225 [Candidatus Saccharibacteria bacterium RIFCSPHIGHO2_02_FULL_46_12]OGL32793.1 MAG: hypothetical protein A3E76_05630 [Candidatus Saccharibacteria bacterium RIFCSPHIGHO2_12_FULL_44_22]
MKKIIIISAAILSIIIIGIAITIRVITPEQNPTSNVTFRFSQSDISVKLFKNLPDNQSSEITTMEETTTLVLDNGSYYYIPSGIKLAGGAVNFDITNDTQFVVDPTYSREVLNTELNLQQTAIHNTIKQTYSLIDQNYTIQQGKLYNHGQWYITTLTDKRATNRNPFDTYRIVALNENGVWQTVTKPELVLSAIDYPGIPKNILTAINAATTDTMTNTTFIDYE